MPSGPPQSFCLGGKTLDTGASNVFRRGGLGCAFRKVGIILDTVASNVPSPFLMQTLTEVLTAQAMRPSCKAAIIVRSAPESARSHSILQSVASSLASRPGLSDDRTRSRTHRSSPTGTAQGRPDGRVADPHQYPVVEPLGGPGGDVDRCHLHRHGPPC